MTSRRWMIAVLLTLLAFAIGGRHHAIAADGAQQLPVPAVAYSARLAGDKQRARLIVDFDKDVSYKITALKNPKSIVINMSRSVFSLNKDATDVPKSFVESVRFGTIDAHTSRIVLALSSSAVVSRHKFRTLEESNRRRLIIDFVAASDTQFASVAREEAVPHDGAPVEMAGPAKRAPGRKFLIVLDPGHGGIDYGAMGQQGTAEKNVTLKFAEILRDLLAANPDYEVRMTRDDDSFVSLTKRLDFVRSKKADLLISIHADSLRQRDIRGATIYTLSTRGSDRLSRQLARKQNRTDLIAGLGLPELAAPVNDILIDLTRRETRQFSKRFANALVLSLEQGVRLISNPLRSANFFVLRAPEVPAVLMELGYLSNARDEELLKSRQWHEMVANLVTRAVDDLFAPQLAEKR
ncbi:MAG: N-acetylmuramoyl-L-alanine amidase [Ahrensia sp.]|nr:N-acetylmuramoyl-L-alanine amidase [Ahrensia sp.]